MKKRQNNPTNVCYTLVFGKLYRYTRSKYRCSLTETTVEEFKLSFKNARLKVFHGTTTKLFNDNSLTKSSEKVMQFGG